jgi:hypothetical protein
MSSFPGLRVPLVLGRTGDFLVKSLEKDQLDPKRWEIIRGDQEGLFGNPDLDGPGVYDKEFLSLIHHDPKSGKWDGVVLSIRRSEFSVAGYQQILADSALFAERKQRGWHAALEVWGVNPDKVSGAEGEVEDTKLPTEMENSVRYAIKLRASNGRIFDGGEGPGLGGLWIKLNRQLHEWEQPEPTIRLNLTPTEPGFFGVVGSDF